MKMKLSSFLLLATLLGALSTSCDNTPAGKNVTITLKNSDTDKVFVFFKPFDGSDSKRDTLTVTNGRAVYAIPSQAGELTLTSDASYVTCKPISASPILLESNKIVLLLDGESPINIEASIKESGVEYIILNKNINQELKNALTDVQTLNASIDKKIAEMIAIGDPTMPKVHELDVEIQTLKGVDRRDVYLNYVKQNPSNMLAGYMLTNTHVDSLGVYYNTLSNEVKNGVAAPALNRLFQISEDRRNALDALEKVIEGTVSPSIICKDINNADFDLNLIKSKYTLVDFWGSWCPYCVKAFPKLKEYYTKYKGNLEIVGVACRDSDKKWREAVATYELPWLQLTDTPVVNGQKISVAYGIRNYPTLFLLDENKVIVRKFVGATPELYTVLDELLGSKK